jgi:hypothetical protein
MKIVRYSQESRFRKKCKKHNRREYIIVRRGDIEDHAHAHQKFEQ